MRTHDYAIVGWCSTMLVARYAGLFWAKRTCPNSATPRPTLFDFYLTWSTQVSVGAITAMWTWWLLFCLFFFPTLLIVRCVGGWVLTTHWLNIFLGLGNPLCSDRPFRYSIYSEFIGFPAQLNKQFNCWCLEWGSVSVGIQIHSIYTFTLYRKAFIDESGDHSLYWILNACQASLKKTIEII